MLDGIHKHTSSKMSPDTVQARDWKAFVFETGAFLLHVPTAHILEASPALAAAVQREGEELSVATSEQLRHIQEQLPVAPLRVVETPSIKAIALNIVQSCNLRCTYCYAGDGDYGKNSRMSFELARQIIDFFAKDQPHLHIVFFGGEPLLNFRMIKQVIEYCATLPDKTFSYALTTNATLMTPAIVEFFAAHQVKITISYDGHGIHAKHRLNADRRSNSEKLVEKKLQDYRDQLQTLREFDLRATLRRENLEQLEEVIVHTLTSMNFTWSFVRHASSMIGQKFTLADAEKIGAILSRVVDRLLAARDYDKLMRLGNLRSYLHKMHHGVIQDSFCGAGVDYLSVSTSGKFYLCHRFTEDESESVGNITNGLNQQRLAQFAQHRQVKHDPCSSCWMREWCGGGCYHEHKVANGTPFKPDPIFCILRDAEMTQAMRVYTHILRDAPTLLAKKK